MKIIKSLFIVVLALIAIIGVTKPASALPQCSKFVDGEWVQITTGGNNSPFCWWKNAFWNGQVTAAQFEQYCHTPAPDSYDDNCSLAE